MIDRLSLFRLLMLASIRSRMTYRADFFLSIFVSMFSFGVELVGTVFVLFRVKVRAGRNVWSIAFLFGITTASGGLFRLFASELYDFEKYLINGELDSLLIRPAPVLLTLLARGVNLNRLGMPLLGFIVTTACLIHLWRPRHFNAWTLGETALTIGIGAVIWFAIGLAIAAVGFYTQRIDELQVTAIHGPTQASSYPLTIYPKWLQLFFMYVIPIAFASYFPARYTLGLDGNGDALWISAVGACVAVLVASALWSQGIRHYHGSGT